jgi:hypothetical protein
MILVESTVQLPCLKIGMYSQKLRAIPLIKIYRRFCTSKPRIVEFGIAKSIHTEQRRYGMQSYAKSIHTEQRRFQELEVQQVTGPEVKLYPEVCEIKGCVDAGLLNGDYGGVP